MLRLALPRLDGWNEDRRALADAYSAAGLAQLVELPRHPTGAEPAPHMYVVRSERRDGLIEALGAADVQSRALYEVPIHLQPAMAPYANGLELPGTDLASRTNLALPMGPRYGLQTAEIVAEALRQAVNCA